MALELHFLRHAQTEVPPGTLVGSTEVDLSARGEAQADRVAQRLPEGFCCLCSPMRRCRQTLEKLQRRGVATDVRFDERLREMDFGDWEMQTFAEISAGGVPMEAWMEYHHFCFPGGESVAHFKARLEDFLSELQAQKKKENKKILVLSHGGVIRTLLCLALGLDIKKYLLFEVDFASWSTLSLYSEGGVLTALNR